jgi:WD40 repeat protein
MHQYSFIDVVTQVQWSPDNNFILVGIAKRSLAFAKSLVDNEWNCKIDQGMAGLAFCRWAPDSKHVITVSDFNIRMTVWSLENKSLQYIKNPKHADRGICFSKSGKLMALC